MKLPLITSETEHETLLAEIWQLMNSELDSMAVERLEALVEVVMAYEDEHYSIPEK